MPAQPCACVRDVTQSGGFLTRHGRAVKVRLLPGVLAILSLLLLSGVVVLID